MTMTFDVQSVFADARVMYGEAVSQMEKGDIRDAAEKAWCATLRATDALILAHTGVMPEKTPVTSGELDRLADSDGRLRDRFRSLVGRYYSRQTQLHGKCFYLGICEPMATTERRIRETVEYISDAEELADLAG